ncbi:MAG: hypothetical protein LKI35_01065 [Lachnospiraceae bacterium]|nr:hypothetical protein [Lachnospiraceae bacterium]
MPLWEKSGGIAGFFAVPPDFYRFCRRKIEKSFGNCHNRPGFEERIINHKYIVVEKRILYADKDN